MFSFINTKHANVSDNDGDKLSEKLSNKIGQKVDKSKLSLGKSRWVCGYEVKKMPLGAYLRAMNRMEGLPGELLECCFPGLDTSEILAKFREFHKETLLALFHGAAAVAPEILVELVSELTSIPAESLKNDENIGICGFLEILEALISVNRLGELRCRLTGLAAALRMTADGSKG